jgi:type II secretory pathway pseudopilin PulG
MVRALPLSRGGTRASGVTLLEILVAVAVLAVGLSTIFQIFPMGFAASAKSSAQTTAYELAARKLEDVRNNHLFGGIPSDPDMYWGSINAPNPDGTTYSEVNTDGAFRAFPGDLTPERSFFYRVHCVPVVDPPPPRTAQADMRPPKYLEYPHILDPASEESWKTQWRGFASMYRVTVTVRGPLKTLAEAQDDQWINSLAHKGAVEVKLVTYVANKKLGEALLAIDPRCTAETTDSGNFGPDGVPSKPVRTGHFTAGATSVAVPATGAGFVHIVGLDGGYPFPENFTVLNRNTLSATEINDTGPTVVVHDGILDVDVVKDRESYLFPPGYHTDPLQMRGYGLNRTGTDNILIVYKVSDGRFIAESNKIVAIHPPGTLTSGYSGTNSLWRLDLHNPLIASDGDFDGRHGSGDDTNGFCSWLADKTFDSDSSLRTEGEGDSDSDKYGYPAWTGNPPQDYNTRVRFLMRLEKWPR